VIALLKRSNKLNQTLIVFYSDHARRGDLRKKVPLLLWFPGGDHSGTIVENVALVDIAPTILDFMGLQTPEWMEGRSIFSKPDPCRRIVSASAGPWDPGYSYVISKPPFFSLWKVCVIACDRYYWLDLQNNGLLKGFVPGHKGACRCRAPSDANIREFIIKQLNQNGYDTSGIQTKRR
jgi:hypothetical protein